MKLKDFLKVFIVSIIVYLLLFYLATKPKSILRVKDIDLTEKNCSESIFKLAGPIVSEVTIPLHPCSCNRTVNTNWKRNDSQQIITANSSCGDWATARGLKQKVVSYAIYGRFGSAYYRGLETLVSLVADVYPGWIMRVYHGHQQWEDEKQRRWACSLACNNSHLDFCDISNIPDVENATNSNKMVWRTFVLGDPTVDRFLVRDCDAPTLQREADAVAEWIASNKKFHVMRDHPYHRSLIMGGMWGAWNGKDPDNLKEMRETRRKLIEAPSTQSDQVTLNMYVWPYIEKDCLQHDSYRCLYYPGSQPYPSRRVGYSFVGMTTYRNKGSAISGGNSCPVECRPKDHQDWAMC